MNASIRNMLTCAAVALGTLAAGAAHAQPDGHIGIYFGTAPQYEYGPRPYPGSAPVYIYNERPQRYAYNDRWDRRDRRCGAEPWNPNVRYMPGAVVWRKGELYQARRISSQVYNENSPPEWTPNYWRPVDCR